MVVVGLERMISTTALITVMIRRRYRVNVDFINIVEYKKSLRKQQGGTWK